MKPRAAAKIDYYIGIPLCFFLNIFAALTSFLKLTKKSNVKKIPKKIMFIELSEMGAAILGYSAIKKAKDIFKGAKIYFLIFKENADSINVLDVIAKENILTIRSKNLGILLLDTVKVLYKVHEEKIDTVIDMELFSRFTSILTYLSAASRKVGFHKFSFEGLFRGDFLTHKVMYNPYLHISKNFLSLVYALNKTSKKVPTHDISLNKEETKVPTIGINTLREQNIWKKIKKHNAFVDKSKKLIVLNLGLKDVLPLRQWPLESYIKLAERLLLDKNVFIILISAEIEQHKTLETILKNKRCVNLIKQLSLKELIEVFSICELLITHDSGAINIASLTNIKSICLFGPETPLLYRPLKPNTEIVYKNLACSPCLSAYNHRQSQCKNNICVQSITVDEVYKKAKQFLYG